MITTESRLQMLKFRWHTHRKWLIFYHERCNKQSWFVIWTTTNLNIK